MREIKLPPFEDDMPQAWYNQAEAYFRLHRVTDRMFWFYYVQWALTPVQKKLARDILSIPDPPPNAYKLLKERLLRLYDKGEKDRCRRLLSMPPLGGRRPSELLAEMLQLCPRDDVDGKIIRYMFLFRLTPTMQSMLGEDDTSSIANLAAPAGTSATWQNSPTISGTSAEWTMSWPTPSLALQRGRSTLSPPHRCRSTTKPSPRPNARAQRQRPPVSRA
jgi:hypothetical protein